ncbi:hypothetical protein L596_026702 [Steinernema carpocapsae]|uniref:7TM GPCR serpentine receptor class x (Srx) domain-containing protein n=1 Tax=Steinernema carpocapsae TaxID=34508 RepID=A0A4V5ZY92_STECR|nr:hypothetical protein L596_026702 [Steinernema carpocapsae]
MSEMSLIKQNATKSTSGNPHFWTRLVASKANVATRAVYYANRIILVHAIVITVWCTVQNFLFHKLKLFTGPSRFPNFGLNMMWIGNSGLSCFLCLVMNKWVST